MLFGSARRIKYLNIQFHSSRFMLMIFSVLSRAIMRYISQLLSPSDKIIQKQFHFISFDFICQDSFSFRRVVCYASLLGLPFHFTPIQSLCMLNTSSVGNKNVTSLRSNEVERFGLEAYWLVVMGLGFLLRF